MTQGTSAPDKEVKPLTGLRGVAAVVVMLYHFFLADDGHSWWMRRGYLAVDLFFVLSGFVMALSYGHLFAGRFGLGAYRHFLMKRIARVYPLLFCVTLYAAAKYAANITGHARDAYPDYALPDLLANLLTVQSWGLGFICMPPVTWSISTECFAYLLFPLLILAAMRRGFLFPALMAAAAVLGICLCALSPYGTVGPLDITSRDNPLPLLRCLSGFCLGLVACRLARRECFRRLLASSAFTLLVLSALGCALILRAHDLVIFFLYPFLVVALYGNSAVSSHLFANRFAYHLGVISYSIYLIHPLIGTTSKKIEALLAAHLGNGGHVLALLIYMAAVYAASYVSYRLIESPGRKYTQIHAVLRRGLVRRGNCASSACTNHLVP